MLCPYLYLARTFLKSYIKDRLEILRRDRACPCPNADSHPAKRDFAKLNKTQVFLNLGL